MKPLIITVPGR